MESGGEVEWEFKNKNIYIKRRESNGKGLEVLHIDVAVLGFGVSWHHTILLVPCFPCLVPAN